MDKKRYTITSALLYANGPLHIGHIAGAYLPADSDIDNLKNTERWRVLFFYFPLALYITFGLILVFSIKFDSIKFNITKNRNKEALKAIRLIYKHCNENN